MSHVSLAGERRTVSWPALTRYLPILLLALVWEIGTRTSLIPSYALPPLTQVAEAWLKLAAGGEIFLHAANSLYRAFSGLGLAIVIGSMAGILMAWSRIADVFLGPIVRLLYPMPKSALIPVMALWLGFGDASKIVLIFLGCMLPIAISAFNGARGTDPALLWSAASLGAGRLAQLRDVVIPSALPDLLGGIRISLAYSFILLVSSELVAARKGLGYMIGVLGEGGVYDGMFAAVLTVAVIGFIADRGYLVLMRRVLRWRT